MGGVGGAAAPLEGKRVAVLRAEAQGRELCDRLRSLGAEPVSCPVIEIAPPASYDPLDSALAATEGYDWIVFTSANAVEAVADRLALTGLPLPAARFASIGPATAAALSERLRPAALISPEHHSDALARSLAPARGQRILIPAGDLAGPDLAEALSADASVEVVTAYRTVPANAGVAELARELRSGSLDAILFTSGSTVHFLVRGLAASGERELLAATGRPALLCIGPATAAAARDAGLPVDAVANPHTTEGMLDALGRWFLRS